MVPELIWWLLIISLTGVSASITSESPLITRSFDKRFTLPEEINTKKIKAKVENGVLTLTLPIKEETENFIDVK